MCAPVGQQALLPLIWNLQYAPGAGSRGDALHLRQALPAHPRRGRTLGIWPWYIEAHSGVARHGAAAQAHRRRPTALPKGEGRCAGWQNRAGLAATDAACRAGRAGLVAGQLAVGLANELPSGVPQRQARAGLARQRLLRRAWRCLLRRGAPVQVQHMRPAHAVEASKVGVHLPQLCLHLRRRAGGKRQTSVSKNRVHKKPLERWPHQPQPQVATQPARQRQQQPPTCLRRAARSRMMF
jgi:hypothetical protein